MGAPIATQLGVHAATVRWNVARSAHKHAQSAHLFDGFVPHYVKSYAHLKADVRQALRRDDEEVWSGKFPGEKESYEQDSRPVRIESP